MAQDITCPHCGAINEYRTELKHNQLTAWCTACEGYIKNLPQGEPQFFFGKFKGKFIHEVNDLGYLEWVLKDLHKKFSPHAL